jgi:hypothetical protein
MKKYLVGAIALVLVASFIPLATAGDTDVISVTLTPAGTLSISCNQSSWDGEGAGLGATGTTSPADTWGSITNDGTLRCDVDVGVNDTSAWTVGGAAAYNVFKFYINIEGDAEYAFADGSTDIDFEEDLAKDATQNFGLKVDMPTSSSTNDAQTTEITFTATVG